MLIDIFNLFKHTLWLQLSPKTSRFNSDQQFVLSGALQLKRRVHDLLLSQSMRIKSQKNNQESLEIPS